jgi:methionyl-tRNA formyltransferase
MSTKFIFFGNGPLAKATLNQLLTAENLELVFHAKTKEDLVEVARLKQENPEIKGILASFGVLIKSDLLELFEPEGILNLHPSLLPLYRGASPIESAILNGDQDFSVSIMKLVKAMDAGPIYYQTTLKTSEFSSNLPEKSEIYQKLATLGANWLIEHLDSIPKPTLQDDEKATFTTKFDKTDSNLSLSEMSATEALNRIRAFQGFPKSKLQIHGLECIILKAHVETEKSINPLAFPCQDGNFLVIDQLQPASKRPMDAKSFINGYLK